jgi:hypothetical protein
MALNVKIALYRGTKSDLSTLSSSGQAGVVALTTDSNELFIDQGSGTAGYGNPGSGYAWIRHAASAQCFSAANSSGMTGLGALIGDFCIRTDSNTLWMLTAYPASTAGNWTQVGVTSAGVQDNSSTYSSDSGTANAYAVTLSPAPTLVAGSEVIFKAAHTNTGASTLAVNGGSPTNIYKLNASTALAAGDIVTGQIVTVIYDGTYFQLQSIPATTLTSGTTVTGLSGPTTNDWVTYIDTSGTQHLAQPGFSNISGTLAQTQLPASIASGSNLTLVDCGTF